MTILDRPQLGCPSEQVENVDQELLNARFHFYIGGLEPTYPVEEHPKSRIVSSEECEPISMQGIPLPMGVSLHEIRVEDPFVEADPAANQIVSEHVEHMEQAIAEAGYDPLIERVKEHPYMKDGEHRKIDQDPDRFNQFTSAWLNQLSLESLREWKRLVPSAIALGYLTSPNVGSILKTKEGDFMRTSRETAMHLTHVADAVAIRDRAAAFAHLAVESVANNGFEHVSWVSLASGTAEPSIKAANELVAAGREVDLHVVDIDPDALKMTKANAERLGFTGGVKTHLRNLMLQEHIDKVMQRSGYAGTGFTVVENTGFEEYLREPGDEIGAGKDMGLPPASEFTRTAWGMVAEGGMLLSGNMVLDRPQRDFVFGVVDWPLINARSEESILRVYDNAGLLNDPSATVSLHRVINNTTGNHLYDLVKVQKAA